MDGGGSYLGTGSFCPDQVSQRLHLILVVMMMMMVMIKMMMMMMGYRLNGQLPF